MIPLLKFINGWVFAKLLIFYFGPIKWPASRDPGAALYAVAFSPNFSFPAFSSTIMADAYAGIPAIYAGPPSPPLERLVLNAGIGMSLNLDSLDSEEVAEFLKSYATSREQFHARSESDWRALAEVH